MNTPAFELVVARYTESLNWLRRVPRAFQVTVYDKSGAPEDNAVPLPNIGREAHTYLHHIVQRYDDLAPLTVFCQGKPFDHAYDFHKTLRGLAESTIVPEEFTWLGHFADTDSADGILFANWSKNETGEGLDLTGFHRALFASEGPAEYPFFGGAQFTVTRERIHERPQSFYEQALKLSVELPQAAHCYERMWDRIFSAENETLHRMNGEKTRYFKPIKRLELTTDGHR